MWPNCMYARGLYMGMVATGTFPQGALFFFMRACVYVFFFESDPSKPPRESCDSFRPYVLRAGRVCNSTPAVRLAKFEGTMYKLLGKIPRNKGEYQRQTWARFSKRTLFGVGENAYNVLEE